uniref:Uncharacterized protein n=1 Tax=mine drainage metagenome TaxID=410659 RepID=E6PI56_9ZZZZ
MNTRLSPRLFLAALGLAALLVACGGGGGPSPVPNGGSTPTPVSTSPGTTPSPVPPTTNASGVVVNDANGQPLAGVPVKLMPWAPCGATPAPASITPENDGCPTPLPSPQATTNPTGQFVLNGAPNGHYLLVIGNDSTTDTGTIQATVHDNVTLTGGNQLLSAPTLPPVPTITPAPWEINGEYRLATLDATTEAPCFVDWQNERAANGLAAGSIDEWLLENVRATNTFHQSPNYYNAPWPGNAYGGLVTEPNGSFGGGSSCATLMNFASFPNAINDMNPQTEWLGAQYTFGVAGFAQFRIDPRSYTDPNVPNWP